MALAFGLDSAPPFSVDDLGNQVFGAIDARKRAILASAQVSQLVNGVPSVDNLGRTIPPQVVYDNLNPPPPPPPLFKEVTAAPPPAGYRARTRKPIYTIASGA